VKDSTRHVRLRPALVVAASAVVGLCFAARAQPKPGLPPPAARMQGEDAPATTLGDMGEPDDALSQDELARAVGEAEAEADGGVPALPAQVMQVPAAAANAVVQHVDHPQGFALWKKAKLVGGAYQARTDDGKIARLSIDPNLQGQMAKLLKMYKPVGAAVVALDPKTGKVLALAEYGDGAATRPLYPAASVFKIITGAALLEKGVSPDVETCYHGGMHGIVGKLLQDKPRLDRRCLSLSMALARSANVVFAKMAVKHLDGDDLRKQAERFLFNKPIFDQPVEQSSATIPDGSGLDFAKSAAGFGQVKLSPMHAALIAAAVGNGGIAEEPSLLDEVDGADVPPTGSMRLMNPETAVSLREMMKLTVSSGTATSSFRERHKNVLGDISVAGKTGSLSTHKGPFKDYSWFVGFAPADDPRIAVAVVVVNGLKWRVHAPYIAREALKAYLVGGPLGQPPVARVKHYRRRKRG
jgi:cell division protein FtsI/penicillin-binding protein 2